MRQSAPPPPNPVLKSHWYPESMKKLKMSNGKLSEKNTPDENVLNNVTRGIN